MVFPETGEPGAVDGVVILGDQSRRQEGEGLCMPPAPVAFPYCSWAIWQVTAPLMTLHAGKGQPLGARSRQENTTDWVGT